MPVRASGGKGSFLMADDKQVRVRVRVPAPVPKTLAEQRALRGDDHLHGRTARQCIDCGVFTTVSHRGMCEDVLVRSGIPQGTIQQMREGRRMELVATLGMRGKRVRRDVAKMDILACAFDKSMSTLETARMLGSLSKALHKRARVDIRDERARLSDDIHAHNQSVSDDE